MHVSDRETDELRGTQPGLGASTSIVRSRRPVQVETSTSLIRASVSSTVKNVISVLPCRLGGIARTRSITAACSG
jgi:hypothetical protein